MHYLFVYRGAHGTRITPVSLEGRLRSPFEEKGLGKTIEFCRLHPGLALLPEGQQRLGDEPAGLTYTIHLPQCFVLYGTAERQFDRLTLRGPSISVQTISPVSPSPLTVFNSPCL